MKLVGWDKYACSGSLLIDVFLLLVPNLSSLSFEEGAKHLAARLSSIHERVDDPKSNESLHSAVLKVLTCGRAARPCERATWNSANGAGPERTRPARGVRVVRRSGASWVEGAVARMFDLT